MLFLILLIFLYIYIFIKFSLKKSLPQNNIFLSILKIFNITGKNATLYNYYFIFCIFLHYYTFDFR